MTANAMATPTASTSSTTSSTDWAATSRPAPITQRDATSTIGHRIQGRAALPRPRAVRRVLPRHEPQVQPQHAGHHAATAVAMKNPRPSRFTDDAARQPGGHEHGGVATPPPRPGGTPTRSASDGGPAWRLPGRAADGGGRSGEPLEHRHQVARVGSRAWPAPSADSGPRCAAADARAPRVRARARATEAASLTLSGWRPDSISARMTPNAKMSVRASTCWPISCSGAMYAGVPIIAPARVSLVWLRAARARPARRCRSRRSWRCRRPSSRCSRA